MDWPQTISIDDAVIAREDTPGGVRFVVYSRRGPQITCLTYAQAEAEMLAFAEQTGVHVWYADGRGLQLVASSVRSAMPA
jgi:hypothetical protein